MKRFLFSILFIGLLSGMYAQVTEGEATLRKQKKTEEHGWKRGAVFGLNVNQSSLINWAAGGLNSFGVNGLTSAFINYSKDKITWDNSLDIGYGVLRQGTNTDFIKTDDRFDFASKFGMEATKKLYYAALLNFKTQLTEGLDYTTSTRISNFLAPAYTLGAIGLDYKPNSYFTAFLSPLTGKITIVNDTLLSNKGAFGVDKGQKIKSEFGGYLRTVFTKDDFNTEVLKNFSVTSKLDLFSNYLHRPQDIDVSWETMFIFKINKYISVNLNTHLIYDADILFDEFDSAGNQLLDNNGDPIRKSKVQFKEILGIGFLYKF